MTASPRGAWDAPVAVTVLTGFLGAGKTSLLRRLLERPDLADTAVLINEFGEIGLDHLLVETIAGETVLLKSGCVCCSIRGDLKDALLTLHARRQRGETPPFTRLVMETTGLADPAPIVATIAADPMLRHHFRIAAVVTVVDAVTGGTCLDTHAESVAQVAAADRLLVSKTDLAEPPAIAALMARLARLNPAAAPHDCRDDASADWLLPVANDGAARLAEFSAWPPRSNAHAHPHAHTDDVQSVVIVGDAPVDWRAFCLWLTMLLNRHGGTILRLKGLVAIRGSETPVVVQGVQHMVHAPMHLEAWPDGDRRTRLVAILRGLDPAHLQRSFDAFTRGGG